MAKKRKKLKHIPEPKYTRATYHVRFVWKPKAKLSRDRGTTGPGWEISVDGKRLREPQKWGVTETVEAPAARTLHAARCKCKRILHHCWDCARVEKLGGASEHNTVRYNGRPDKWEALQEFKEDVVLPRGHRGAVRQAVLAREAEVEAHRRSVEATSAAVDDLVNDLGVTGADVARMLGVTRQRVSQILMAASD